jgi:hypothetical protein
MRYRLALTLLAAAACLGQSPGVETVVDDRWPGKVLQQKLVVAPPEFNPASLRELFAEIRSHNLTFPLVKVDVFTSREAASGNFKGCCELTYARWRDLFDRCGGSLPASAQFIAINDNSAMRVRDETGKIYTAVVSGKDPTVLTIAGATLRLADVISRTIIGRDGGRALTTEFYYWSSHRYTEATAMAVWKELTRSTGLTSTTVSLEPWPWFVLAEGFPAVYPYAAMSEVPTEEQCQASHRVECSSQYGPTAVCWSFGQKP